MRKRTASKYFPAATAASLAALLLLLFCRPEMAAAVGTPAGSVISCQATVSYSIGALDLTEASNTASITVAELIDVTVTVQNGGSVVVHPGESSRYQTFLVSNTGNGTETFTLGIDPAFVGDQFDPVPSGIFQDTNGNGHFDPDADTEASLLTLAADAGATVFIVCDIPSTRSDGTTPLVAEDTGLVSLSADSSTGSGARGTVIANGGDGGAINAILSADLPLSAAAVYAVSSVSVSISKTAMIVDPLGGSAPYPGSTVTYSLQVSIVGSESAAGLTITDPIPASTTYVPGTITLDGIALSDLADADAGETDGSPVSAITVRLGDQEPGQRNITFAVTID